MFHTVIVKISNLDLSKAKPVCVFWISKQTLKLFRMGLFWDAYNRDKKGVGGKNTLHPQNLPHILQ